MKYILTLVATVLTFAASGCAHKDADGTCKAGKAGQCCKK